jgi:hypothetical protein
MVGAVQSQKVHRAEPRSSAPLSAAQKLSQRISIAAKVAGLVAVSDPVVFFASGCLINAHAAPLITNRPSAQFLLSCVGAFASLKASKNWRTSLYYKFFPNLNLLRPLDKSHFSPSTPTPIVIDNGNASHKFLLCLIHHV